MSCCKIPVITTVSAELIKDYCGRKYCLVRSYILTDSTYGCTDGRTDRWTYIRTNICTYDQTDICMNGTCGRMNVRYVLTDIRMSRLTDRWMDICTYVQTLK